MTKHHGRSEFTRFRTSAPFALKLSVFEPGFAQQPDGSRDYYTRNRVVRQQINSPGAPVRVMAEGVRFKTLPPQSWRRDYGRQRVLFILPSDALGDCVGVALFLRAFRNSFPEAQVTVANTGAATDIFGREPGLRVLPLVLSDKEVERHHPIIDLGDIDGWDAVTTQPVDVESVLLDRFGLEPADIPLRPLPARPRIAIAPMASSPLRTLPPALIATLAGRLAGIGPVTIMLNAYQGVKNAYERALRSTLPDGIEVIGGFATTSGLLGFLAAQDYLVCADSGPAHLAKLFGTQGIALYTSASGEVLQGRHRNLARWQSDYAGPDCQAPCGLAKLRETADGRVGCMGSLGVALADLPNLPNEAQPALAERLVIADPVPCVAALARDRDYIADGILAHLLRLTTG